MIVNVFSVIFLIGIEGTLLVGQPKFLTLGDVHIISIYTILAYLIVQGLLIQTLKGQEENKGMSDLSLSVIAIIAQVLIIMFGNKVGGWYIIYSWYVIATLYDLIINNRMILRMFRMSTGVAQE